MGSRYPGTIEGPGTAVNENSSAVNALVESVSMLMAEPRPLARPMKRLKKRSEWPIDEALLVFEAAVDYVAVCNDYDAVADWKRRQAKLNGWLEVLRREPPPMSDEQFAASMITCGTLNRTELDAVLVGTRHSAALLNDIVQVITEQQRRCEETERTNLAVARGRERVAIIMKRCVKRRAEISEATEVRLQQISPEDTSARKSAIEAAYPDLIVLSETACEQINAQTRRVLDVHRRTAAMPIWQFWEMAYKDLIEG
ncbi:hypothetical protein [Mycobacterium intracellulare]|uniref:hypothetical protein n=1 Tax=Mycobacterium intracellulare TaxID=1767 RepID=UPI001CD9D6ED|nr:hypothetical protein [Mycobacterium intracellulare]MCA2353436.1 hypothetical protein [Mycobacterium intracellulare subsp. chimaera]MDM3933886.1 hypothetical protein [Mycobacterium intracellulare subsp. chimaera]